MKNSRKFVIAGIVLVIVASGAFWTLPPLRQTPTSFAALVVSVLGGPLTGITMAASDGALLRATPILAASLLICGCSIGLYYWKRKLWAFFVAMATWAFVGMFYSGIYV